MGTRTVLEEAVGAAMDDRPILRVMNRHAKTCGTPQSVDDSTALYLGYFDNEHGEQAIFVHDRGRRTGTLHLGAATLARSR